MLSPGEVPGDFYYGRGKKLLYFVSSNCGILYDVKRV